MDSLTTSPEQPLTPKKVVKIQKKIAAWFSYYQPNIEHYKKMMRFVILGEQWDDELTAGMESTNTHMFTMNMLRKIANSIIGEQLQNTPDIHVSPLDDEAKQNNAQLIQNILRTFIIHPEAKEAEQVAFMCQTVGGFGAMRLENQYEDNFTNNQKIVVETVYDPTHCYWDPDARKSHKGDGNYCGYYGVMSKEEYKRKFKRKDWPKSSSLPGCGFEWVTEDSIVVVYHYEKKITTKKLLTLSDGNFMLEDKYEEISEYMQLPDIEDERDVPFTEILAFKLVGDEIIEESTLPGEMLPVLFGGGANTTYIDGEQKIRSFLADAVPPQIYVNYVASRSADLVKKYDTAQWGGPPECIDGFEEYYTSGAKTTGYKPWKLHYDDQGMPHKPEKFTSSTLPPHLFEQYQRANNDIYNIVGVYESQLGAQGNEISGKAIDARTGQGNNNTAVLFTANKMLINRMAEVMLSMLPTVYGSKRIMSIDTQEYGAQQITINNPVDEYEVENDITRGRYNVVARASSSFEAQKRQNLEMILQVCQSLGVINTPYGQFTGAQLFADKILQNIPINGSNEMSNRALIGIPKEIIAAGKGQKVPPPQPQPNPQEEIMKDKIELERAQIQAKMQATQTSKYVAEVKAAAEIQAKRFETQIAIANAHTKMHDNHTKTFESVLRRHDAAAHHGQQQQ